MNSTTVNEGYPPWQREQWRLNVTHKGNDQLKKEGAMVWSPCKITNAKILAK
jgi:hypothetical protein